MSLQTVTRTKLDCEFGLSSCNMPGNVNLDEVQNPMCDTIDCQSSSKRHDPDAGDVATLMMPGETVASSILRVEREMSALLPTSSFVGGKVTHVYNPLEYAAAPHNDYVRRYAGGSGEVRFLLVGMNPGPWGMSQNGVPFGEVDAVRDWLGVTGEVESPVPEHPQRPISGLNCTRSEVSGRRFWGLWRELCDTPDRFFQHAFVYNFCPLAFMERSGKNVTPNMLQKGLRQRVEAACGPALAQVIQILGSSTVIGIGKYAEEQARRCVTAAGLSHVTVHPLLHPSPMSPQANKDWAGVARRQLAAAGLLPLLSRR